jgi:hypothetical protein
MVGYQELPPLKSPYAVFGTDARILGLTVKHDAIGYY